MQHITTIPGNKRVGIGSMLKNMVTKEGCNGDQHLLRECLAITGTDPEMGGAVTKLGLCDCQTLHQVFHL